MFLIKKCAICNRHFNSITNRNHVKSYRTAIRSIESPESVKQLLMNGEPCLPDNNSFICKDCVDRVYRAAEVSLTCACCHDEFRSYNISKEKNAVRDLARRIALLCHGRDSFHVSGEEFICPGCRKDLINKARDKAWAELEQTHREIQDQPILLFPSVPHDKSHCARCGALVSECSNYFELLKALYNELYGYSDYESECRSVIGDYLKSGVICSNCCWQLRPSHVRADFILRCREWISGTETTHPEPKYDIVHRFNQISLDEDNDGVRAFRNGRNITITEAFEHELRNRSLLLGANSYVEFSVGQCSNALFMWHKCSAVPVLLKPKSGVACAEGVKGGDSNKTNTTLPQSVIVDGSNIIRFPDGGTVDGLCTSIEALKKRGCRVMVLLDANIFHVLEEKGDAQGKSRLEKLLSENPAEVKLVPAGSRADDFILLRANGDGSHILSNDRFEQYVDRYPWLKEQRLHKFMFMDGRLLIPDFGIDVAVR